MASGARLRARSTLAATPNFPVHFVYSPNGDDRYASTTDSDRTRQTFIAKPPSFFLSFPTSGPNDVSRRTIQSPHPRYVCGKCNTRTLVGDRYARGNANASLTQTEHHGSIRRDSNMQRYRSVSHRSPLSALYRSEIATNRS